MKVKLQDIIDALEWDVDSAVVDDFYKVANTIADSRGFINTDNAEFQLFLRDFLESHELDYQYDLIKNVLEPYYDHSYDLEEEFFSVSDEVKQDSINKGNEAIKHLPNYLSICHNDMDSKNVMWLGEDYKLIDLECLGYSNPYLELYELALCWSGYEKCNINFDLFKTFFKAYFDNTKLDKNVDWESIYYANNGRLEWLEFNIKRSLMIDCDTKEEQEIGMNEVKETIEHVIYYDKVKNEILKNINDLIK